MEKQTIEQVSSFFHQTRQVFVRYYLDFARQHRSDFEALDVELSNIHAGVAFCLEQENFSLLAEFVGALCAFWVTRGHWDDFVRYSRILMGKDLLQESGESIAILSQLAIVEEARGNYDEARRLYEQQLQFYTQSSDTDNGAIVTALTELVRLARLHGDDDDVQRFLEHKLAVAQRQQSAKDQVDILLELAVLHQKKNELVDADSFCQQGLIVARRIGYLVGVIEILRRQASVHRDKGDFQGAYQFCQAAVDATSGMGDQTRASEVRVQLAIEQVDILLQLAALHQKEGELNKADSFCQQGLEIAQVVDYQVGVIDSLRQRASIHRDEGDLQRALQLYQEALGAALEMDDQARASEIREQLTALKALMGKDVFISYSHRDRKFVERLARDLRSAGFAVWWDEWEIKVGQPIIQKVSEGIEQSAFLAVVLSPHSVQSSWVQRELGSALMKQLSVERDITILPLLVADCEIPVLLREIKWADFRRDYNSGMRELADTLAAERPMPEPLPAEELSVRQRALQNLRDPIWQGIGAVVGIIALLVTVWAIFRPQGGSISPTATASITPTGFSEPTFTPTFTSQPTATPEPTPTATETKTTFQSPRIYTVAEGDIPSYGKQHSIARDPEGQLHVFYATDGSRKLWHAISADGGMTWSEPTFIGEADEGQEPSAVVDSAGRIHLVWGAWKAGVLYYSLYSEAQWSEPEALLEGTFARDIAIDSANYPHIVISAADTYHIFQRATIWDAEIAAQGAWHPDVVVDRQDNTHIVYNDGNFYPTSWVRVYHRTYDGRAWSAAEQLTDGPFWSGGAAMAIDNDDTIHVVWLSPKSKTGGDDTIYYARFVENEWQESLPIGEVGTSAGSTGKESPAIAVDEHHIVYVFWRGVNQKDKAVIFFRALLEDGWTPVVELADSEASDVWWPSVAYQQGWGEGVDVVWSATIGTHRVVRYTHVSFSAE